MYSGQIITPSIKFFELKDDGQRVPITILADNIKFIINTALGAVDPIDVGLYTAEIVIVDDALPRQTLPCRLRPRMQRI